MDRGINVGTRMAVHMQVADQVQPRIPLGKLRGWIPGNETAAPEELYV